ncbi:uncharacterized protein EHS24_001089 [Apiotrichum porosum]|uniref:Uncharacterized protein n=1 Tax=Apiotrichum porosum TaxID=105984 RepID=A0A427YC45_9TREE|nr:uncharacterized protein EHS24_001089 [Apiotrichum porosum]RSH88544.1 hypothetical protein EHS24_001089 [Apiotrichum porosum]
MDDLTADQLSFFDATYDTCYDKMLQDSTTCIEWQNLFGSDSFLGSDMTAREARYDGLSMWLPPASSSSSLGYTPRSVATYFKCAISDDPDIPDVISVGQSSCRGIPYGADGRRNVHNERPQQGNAMNGFNKFYQQHKEHYDVSFATPIAFPKPRKEPRAEELIYQPTIIEFSEALFSFWLGTIGGNNNHMRPRTAPHDPAAYPYLPGNWKNPLSDPPASRGISISRATHEEVKAQRKKMQPIYYANIMANLRAEPIRLANYAKRWARNCARMTARPRIPHQDGDKLRADHRARHDKNRHVVRARNNEYHAENAEYIKGRKRAHRAANKDKINPKACNAPPEVKANKAAQARARRAKTNDATAESD